MSFNPWAAACHQRLAKAEPAWRQGYADVAAIINGPGPLASRLPDVAAANQKALETGRAAPAAGPGMSEDDYLCCVRDTLEARVAKEAREISEGNAAAADKRASLESLLKAVQALPWSGPKWTQGDLPRIEQHVRDALSKLQ